MAMGWIWTIMIGISVFCSVLTGRGPALSGACLQGAQNGLELAVRIGGSLCLWSGVGTLLQHTGVTSALSRLLAPVLHTLFPASRQDRQLSQFLSGNLCANLLGLGNAATPMGIQAARRMCRDETATDELCRLIVLNTASIQLIPTSVAAVRSGLGCETPFDILPAVWITSACSAGLGLTAAWLLGKGAKH